MHKFLGIEGKVKTSFLSEYPNKVVLQSSSGSFEFSITCELSKSSFKNRCLQTKAQCLNPSNERYPCHLLSVNSLTAALLFYCRYMKPFSITTTAGRLSIIHNHNSHWLAVDTFLLVRFRSFSEMKNDSQISLSHKKSCCYSQLISKPHSFSKNLLLLQQQLLSHVHTYW